MLLVECVSQTMSMAAKYFISTFTIKFKTEYGPLRNIVMMEQTLLSLGMLPTRQGYCERGQGVPLSQVGFQTASKFQVHQD